MVPVTRHPATPKTRAPYRCSDAVVWACTTALVSTWPAGPGTARLTVATTMVPIEPLSKRLASPTSPITPWTATRVVMKAMERAWLKPSATRIRMKASLRSRRFPTRDSVVQASSPDRSNVSGTRLAVLTAGLSQRHTP